MNNEENFKKLVVVTGMSGAGKSVAIQCLEDLGYFCVDNLPPILLPKFVELMQDNNQSLSRVALGVDLRGKDFFDNLREELQNITNLTDILVQVLFIEANDNVLVSRYKATRRTHPISSGGTPLEAINEERRLLADLRGVATHIVDSSDFKPKELRSKVIELFGSGKDNIFSINVMSFGFKHGVPIDADIVFDVRFLPNPYYIEELRPLTGMDARVYDYVMKWKETEIFYTKLMDLLKFVIPGYMREGKSQVVIAIGCTGGQHRSVALAERISNELIDFFDFELNTRHRDALIEGIIDEKLKICLIGGGTGLSVMARGLKHYPVEITAIVTVADDGGSTGKIRDVMDIPAPGDVRNVLAALSDVEPMLEKLFQYRFNDETLGGHPVGNLMLAAMTDVTSDFGHAVKELSKILNVKGTVIPSTNTSPILNAIMEDGEIVVGESLIPLKDKKIESVFLTPSNIKPMKEAVEALLESDLIVMGPGSLYTSIIPNLVLDELAEAIVKSDAKKLYVSNIMTQRGETIDYTVGDHIEAIHKHVGQPFIQFVIANDTTFDNKIHDNYARNNSTFVHCDYDSIRKMGIELITDNELVDINLDGIVRHNNEILADMIYELALSEISTIEFNQKEGE